MLRYLCILATCLSLSTATSEPFRGCQDENYNMYPLGPIPDNDPCKSCECTPGGLIACRSQLCASLPCPEDEQEHPAGVCCATCKPGCQHRGAWVPNGPIASTDPCEDCTCDGTGDVRSVQCARKICGWPRCEYGVQPVTLPGNCCPGCPPPPITATCRNDAGETYPVGPVPNQAACQFACQCRADGNIICASPRCAMPSCPGGAAPITLPDVCCPVCPPTGCQDASGAQYSVGNNVPNDDPCTTCECTGSGIQCRSQMCAYTCPADQVIPREGECCGTCRSGCEYNSEYVPHGPIETDNACSSCFCNGRSHLVSCSGMSCDILRCGPGYVAITKEGKCCPSCEALGCTGEDGQTYNVGDDMRNSDPCKSCICSETGRELCASISCGIPNCPGNVLPMTQPGDCCPSCPPLDYVCLDSSTGDRYPGGPVPSSDPCRSCECEASGWITCRYTTCSYPRRCPDGSRPVPRSGQCCPSCY